MSLNSSPPLPAYGLGLDTTTATLTLILGSQTHGPRYRAWHLERDLSSQLHPLLQDFLRPQRWADLAWLAVLKGPGSFTGTRLGVVTARTLAQQLNLPLFGFSTLAIAAYIAIQGSTQADSVVAISQPGQRGTVYGAIYRIQTSKQQVSTLVPDQLLPEAEWHQVVSSTSNLDQVIQTKAQEPIPAKSLANAVMTLGWHAWQAGERPLWSEVLPYYG